jgi:membrane associated rhomboid family serine protease
VLLPLRDNIPRVRFPVATLALVVANALVFLFELSLTARGQALLVATAGAIPYEIVHGVDIGPRDLFPLPGSIWTSMFLHGGWLHLIGNMWFLWLFGDNVEDALGAARYLLFYFLVGTVGALAQCFAMPSSTAPMIGASGAVAGALGAYVMLYPRARIDTLVMIPLLWPVIKVRAWVYLGLWFIGQFLLESGSGVAWMAHVGGFIAGAGLVRILAPRPTVRAVEVEYIPPPTRPPRW